jgi:hypothetical protein
VNYTMMHGSTNIKSTTALIFAHFILSISGHTISLLHSHILTYE